MMADGNDLASEIVRLQAVITRLQTERQNNQPEARQATPENSAFGGTRFEPTDQGRNRRLTQRDRRSNLATATGWKMEACRIFFKNDDPSRTRIPDPRPRAAGNGSNAGTLRTRIVGDKLFRGYRPPNFSLLFHKTTLFDSIGALGRFPGQF
ncbi:hypothetical protein MCOR14_012091 [Pyricularia oryzae]|nr:hypothetical protein MCOR13_011909 [Pyricularia oryzae]KAI6608913.1 hypothetical protein MCOR14_012091 [Pyricularia oryzae]